MNYSVEITRETYGIVFQQLKHREREHNFYGCCGSVGWLRYTRCPETYIQENQGADVSTLCNVFFVN